MLLPFSTVGSTPVQPLWGGGWGLQGALCQEPALTRDHVWCCGVTFLLATSPGSPLPGPGGPQGGVGGLLPCLSPLRSRADADEQTFPSALLRDVLNPGFGWLPARPPKGPGGRLSSSLFFQRLQKAARPHLIQIY